MGNEKNVFRNMVALLQTCGIPQLVHVIPEECTVTHTLPPTVIFSLLHRSNREQFGRSFGAYRSKLKEFWAGLFSSVDGIELRNLHRFLRGRSPEDLSTSIPLMFHEDEGPFSKTKSTNLLSWGSIVSIGDELETRFVVSSNVSVKGIDAMESRASWQEFFNEMDLLASGRDSKGEPLALDADGVSWAGILLFSQSDFEKHASWGLGNFPSADTPCQSCCANRLDVPLTDLRPNAAWRPTSVMTDVQYRSRCLKPHPMQSSHYFNRFLVRFDVMHAIDHNGVAGSVMASIIGYFYCTKGVLARPVRYVWRPSQREWQPSIRRVLPQVVCRP